MPFIPLLIAGLSAFLSSGSPSVQAAGPQKKPSVRIYVFAASMPGAPKEEDAGRDEAVTEMRDALRRKAGLEIVNSREEADVFVEVLGREERQGMEGGFGGAAITKMGEMYIRLHISSGDQESDIKGVGQGTWSRAAKDAADRVLKWVARLEKKAAEHAEYAEYTRAAEYAENAEYVDYMKNVHSA